MDLKEIQELIRIFSKSGLGQIKLKQDDFQLELKSNDCVSNNFQMMPTMHSTPMMTAPIVQSAPSAQSIEVAKSEAPAKPASEAKTSGQVTIKAPMIGTFYRSSGPDKDPFVKVGDRIEKGQSICIIEAMKLFNEIESEVSGTVVKVLVDDASPVEYDQPLFLIEP
jgi:acetyl-CoA carboxylase biotin carboxyl carrier protein